MSNSQGNKREIIRLPEFPRSTTPEPAPKKQRTSRSSSSKPSGILKEARVTRSARVDSPSDREREPTGPLAAEPARDPEVAAIEDARVTSSPSRVFDSSERSSEPQDIPQVAASWASPRCTTSTGVDTGEMSMTMLDQAAWDLSADPLCAETGADGTSIAAILNGGKHRVAR
jgi:hypothetical protein